MDEPITWNTHIKPMLAIGVVPDMYNIGYPLDDYQFVAQNYKLLRDRMADDSMPPGVSDQNIAFIQTWIDNDAPASDYPKVQEILDRAIGGETAIGRHGKFWRGLGRDDFVALSIYDEPVVELKNGAGSALVKALKGEPPFDGSSFPRMPVGFWWTTEIRTRNLQLFEQWKADGFLEDTEGPTMTSFQDVVGILNNAVGGPTAPVGAHGAFWRDVTRDDFVAKSVYGLALIDMNNGAGSNLVKALKGEAPFDGSQYPRMPAGGDAPVSDSDIKIIQDWIDNGSPA